MPTVEREGVRLHFSEIGTGEPVLLHTGGGGDGRMWELAGYPEHLAGRRLILFDHRGHGRSDCPSGLDAHRPDEYVADVVAVLDALGLDRAVLVGYSAGANICLRFAARHPGRCRAVVALGAPPTRLDTSTWDRALAARVREVGMRRLMEEMSAGEAEPAPGWLLDNLATTSSEMFALYLEASAESQNVWALLPQVTAPALLVVGGSELGDPDDLDRAIARLPDATAVVQPGYGHLQNFWQAGTTGPAVRGFLDSRL